MSSASLSGKDPASYEPHGLHSKQHIYLETNCFTDVVVELLHACGYEPLAMMGHIVRMDFEGDQWTFFKPPVEDLELLYGVELHEMQPYRSLPQQILQQLDFGRTIIVELDSWYLPDLASSSYRSEHVKTSVAIDWIDIEAERLHYFHGPGMFALEGEDFRNVLRLEPLPEMALPPYAELVRFDAGPKLEGEELKAAARESLRRNLRHRPKDNPVKRFQASLTELLPRLLAADLGVYHSYAFATVRIAGSGFQALGSFSEWLYGERAAEVVAAIDEFVQGSKALSFRLARRREFDTSILLGPMAEQWDRAIAGLIELSEPGE